MAPAGRVCTVGRRLRTAGGAGLPAYRAGRSEPATRLLTHLIEEGATVIEQECGSRDVEHDRAVEELTSLAAFYSKGYLDDVREGWGE